LRDAISRHVDLSRQLSRVHIERFQLFGQVFTRMRPAMRQGLSVSENGQRGRQRGNATPEARREVRGENPLPRKCPYPCIFCMVMLI
jgi:hypothetical protein